MERLSHLELPASETRDVETGRESLNAPGSVVIIGANGSGKTKLGAWIEFDGPQAHRVHRVGAQRSLMMPDEVLVGSLEIAELALYTGIDNPIHSVLENIRNNPASKLHFKRSQRWGGRPSVALTSDFDKLLGVLFAEHADASVLYRAACRAAPGEAMSIETRLERAKRVWEEVFPHRELVLRSGTIEARLKGTDETYKGGEMSDGERVAFYLIGHSLAAAPGSILIVDEPEIHLHKAVQSRLWDQIERERTDCLLVYLTHDLDFAASRHGAAKVWLRSYSGRGWAWEMVPEDVDLPEDILLAVLGSRKPILFVEGDRGGLEQMVFSRVYPEWTIVPRGGCESVISATAAFGSLRNRHHLECSGIIDRDYRSDEAVDLLQAKGLYVLGAHEIENLLLLPKVLAAVSEQLRRNPADDVEQVKNWVLSKLRGDRERIASVATAAKIEASLRRFNAKACGPDDLQGALDALAQSVGVAGIYGEIVGRIDQVLSSKDYEGALRIYGNKGLVREVGRFFGLAGEGYVGLVGRLLRADEENAILRALREALPVLAKDQRDCLLGAETIHT